MEFEFSIPTRIIFGPGRIDSIGQLTKDLGDKVLILYGCPEPINNRLTHLLISDGKVCSSIHIDQEPTLESIRLLVDQADLFGVNMIIGIGGGSAIDSAKATAALVSNPGDITDYLEIIGNNMPLENPAIPFVAIPTTSGTGSEVTKNAVLVSVQNHVKVSLRSSYLYPKVALIDPELILNVPPFVTAYTGMDTLTQLIEAYTCNVPNPVTEILCLDGISRVATALYQVYKDGNNLKAREEMAMASLYSGIALANTKLGAVHGLAGPLGGEINAPHGVICACLLPLVTDSNLAALDNLDPENPAIARYDTVGKILRGDNSANFSAAVEWIRNFNLFSKIPQLSHYGLSQLNFDKIIENSLHSSSMKGNPITLSKADLRNILQKSL